jgi:hypothetical protein
MGSSRTSRAGIGPYKRYELVTGSIVYVLRTTTPATATGSTPTSHTSSAMRCAPTGKPTVTT